ncbi:MAG TPA: ABC transporter permease [Candidatus Binataceae bacterium]|nr:ABC transporter permease [Candidatus Binataceae bacterium]
MRFEILVSMRYLRARRRERFVSLIAVISLVGVAIGTFALTMVLAVMSGFEEDLRDRLLAFNPQINIIAQTANASQLADLARTVAKSPGIAGVAPYDESQVLLVSSTAEGLPAYVSAGTLRAVVAHDNPVLAELKRTLRSGSLVDLDTTFPVTVTDRGTKRDVQLPGALLGQDLAEELGLRIGDPVIVISPASIMGGGAPRLRRFAVAGFFHSGMYEFDSSLIFVSLANGEGLLANSPQLDRGLEVRTTDLFEAPEIAHSIAQTTGSAFTVSDWTQANAPLFASLKLEKFTYFLVLLLIVLVAAFNIIATLVMVVMERRKEIAILRAMGARARNIASIFLWEGAALGVGGTIIGVGFGLLVSWLMDRYHFVHLPAGLFMVDTVPVRLYAVNFFSVAIAAIVLCLAGAVYPAWQARALRPVEVIRYE